MAAEVITVLTVMALYTAVVVSPGPAFAVATRAALVGSREYALGVPFGLALAAALYAVLAMMGLHVFVSRLGWLTQTVQILGGLYLICLGIMLWRRSHQHPNAVPEINQPSGTFFRGLVSGVLVNLSNPKAIVFFVSLYAVAVPLGTPVWVKAAILVLSFIFEAGWYLLVVHFLSGDRSRRLFRRFSLILERTMGTFLVILGGQLFLQSR